MSFQVTNSPFSQEQAELLNRLIPTLRDDQQIWLSGYLSALSLTRTPAAGAQAAVQTGGGTAAAVLERPSEPAAPQEALILFGSQTGTSQGLAKKLARTLEERGIVVTLSKMSDFKPNALKKIKNLLIVVSTHGEGDPPDNAISFFEFLHSKRAPQLEELNYSVLALGDSSYEFFCQTGKDFDKRLEELGAKRLAPRVDCDLDYDEPASQWFSSVVAGLSAASGAPAAAGAAIPAAVGAAEESGYSRTNPFEAEVLENLNLNGRGSDRETRHLELSLEGSGLQYEPGDCLGIYPENHPELVDALIHQLGFSDKEIVQLSKKGEQGTLREALLYSYEITVLTKPLVEQAAAFSESSRLKELTAPGREQELRDYLQGRDLLDLVQDFGPWRITAAEFVSLLRKMPARLYSIASSLKANPDEVHLTIRTVRYESHGRDRYGVCSVHASERLQPGDSLPVYVQHNENFKLPADPGTPVIMIGPGTGVAPFRAFLQEREETGAEGKTWLFYGDQHFSTDFLYQVEWQKWLKDGVLTRMDVAFSRDTDQKVYVQHRMLEKSKELYQWLQDGAYVYVCGDEKYMANDVHLTLNAILEQEGGMSPDEASAYLAEMQQQKRYQRDIY